MFYVFCFVSFLSIQLVYGVDELIGSNGTIYRFERKENQLGAGSFGEAIAGLKIIGEHTEKVAMKFEKIQSSKPTYVFYEKKFYKLLNGHPSIPTFHDCLRDRKGNAVLIIELLGHNLKFYRKYLGRRFSIKTTMMIGIQVLTIVEYLHSKGVVYNDIKPDNFAVGHDDSSKIYILDFGLCTFYLQNGHHIEQEKHPAGNGRGTGFYMSTYAHNHLKLSRRDDIESIAYMLIEFLQGKLPWSSANMNVMRHKKQTMKIDHIVGSICTNTLILFLKHARQLEFKEKPDYQILKGLLLKELEIHGQMDMQFDWTNVDMAELQSIVDKGMKKRKSRGGSTALFTHSTSKRRFASPMRKIRTASVFSNLLNSRRHPSRAVHSANLLDPMINAIRLPNPAAHSAFLPNRMVVQPATNPVIQHLPNQLMSHPVQTPMFVQTSPAPVISPLVVQPLLMNNPMLIIPVAA